jgi:hypothetical protein
VITIDTLYDIAKSRLVQRFDYVDFDSNPSIAKHIAEILTCDALMKAGSGISIRWLSEEDQHKRLDGIEQLMFDLALEDIELLSFYRNMIQYNSETCNNRLILKPGGFRHHTQPFLMVK